MIQKMYTDRIKRLNEIIRCMEEDPQKGVQMFIAEYGKMIATVTLIYCKTPDKADEAYNSVLIKVWRNRAKLSSVKNPEGFIYTIAKNCSKDVTNKVWHYELNENICSAKDSFKEIFDNDGFEYYLRPLNECERQIYVYYFSHGCTFKEIAKIMHRPLATITSIYYRAQKKIKNYCKKQNLFE